MPRSKYATWYNQVTVKQAAQIITEYFGDKSEICRTRVENFSRIGISFCYITADVERKSFMALKTLNLSVKTGQKHRTVLVKSLTFLSQL